MGQVLAHDKLGVEPERPADRHGLIDVQLSVSASARLDFATCDFERPGPRRCDVLDKNLDQQTSCSLQRSTRAIRSLKKRQAEINRADAKKR
jgi:hypothetical protein